jgi:ubiquinone/menaquinone biosynthesis C-methylase UbiE
LKVLDVGCGIGLGHGEIAQAVGELHGVDVSRDSLDLAARDNPHVHYKAYEGNRLPHEDSAFDCAYAICVLHHIPEPQWPEFMQEMARVVRPGGQMVVIEHNPLNPATRWVVRTCELDKNAVLLQPWRLRRLFIDAGLSAPKVRYTLFTPFAQKFFRALDRALSRVPLGAQYIVAGRKASRPGQ